MCLAGFALNWARHHSAELDFEQFLLQTKVRQRYSDDERTLSYFLSDLMHIFVGLKRSWDQKLSSGWMMSGQLSPALTGLMSLCIPGRDVERSIAHLCWLKRT